MPEPRPRPRRLVDPRLLIGAGLVLASIAGVVGVLAAADRTVEVFAARDAIGPGETLDRDALTIRRVALDGAEARYLAAGARIPEGAVAVRPIGQGELIPSAALAAADGSGRVPVVVPSPGELGSGVRPGVEVELWAAAASAGEGETAVIAGEAVVVRLVERRGLVGDEGAAAVEVLLDREDLPAVLDAVAEERPVSPVPLGVPLESSRG
ncbi:SAF domain-containing protein [Homoserinibacter sp. YIM 151385]|uniref:SAF domain-containing protein n=1 Tax=Homoserinibacter sp. YIM 151385 TaxID=2985506 RepID=UPI0022F0DFEA|nr:SAF domain-containing protein [Homoserinibacter sp. YIM 151385]WBU37820.1 hypothetical protein OF852_13005 [Homoserinibacter sp. YIM 151385]